MTASETQAPTAAADCVFCKIAAGQIPSRRLYDDDELIAFFDIHPAAPVHFLIVPRRHIESLGHCTPADEGLLGRMMGLAVRLAREQGCDIRPDREGGYRTLINTGRDGGQEVFHLHLHVMGGPRPWKRG
jgi:histidine triad (HIT) family protein